MTLEIVRTVSALRLRLRTWRDAGQSVALVPTMGALHDGHLALVRRARELADRVVTTVFVNPTQFGPGEDFAVYPRDEHGDVLKLAGAGADVMFAPPLGAMYSDDHATRVSVPGLGDILEGAHRPGFFTGVATVVTKLLLQALPDVAVFGEKDYQQLQVIRRLVADLDIPVTVVGVQTVREPDGLARSSRNAYLSAEQRAAAPALHRVLDAVAGGLDPAEGERRLAAAGFGPIDYLTVRDARTLGEPHPDRPRRVLAAAWLGHTRLIDNVAV